MANSNQSRKRARQAQKHRVANMAQRSRMRTAIRKVIKAIDGKDAAAADAAYKEMVPLLDRYADRGLIHKRKAARHKSRLGARIRALTEGDKQAS